MFSRYFLSPTKISRTPTNQADPTGKGRGEFPIYRGGPFGGFLTRCSYTFIHLLGVPRLAGIPWLFVGYIKDEILASYIGTKYHKNKP